MPKYCNLLLLKPADFGLWISVSGVIEVQLFTAGNSIEVFISQGRLSNHQLMSSRALGQFYRFLKMKFD